MWTSSGWYSPAVQSAGVFPMPAIRDYLPDLLPLLPSLITPDQKDAAVFQAEQTGYWGRLSSLPLTVFCPLAPESLSSSPLLLSRKDFFSQVPDKCLGFVSRAALSSACWTRCSMEGGVWLHPCSQKSVSCLLKVTLQMWSLCIQSWIYVKAKPFYLQSNLKYVILTFLIVCNADTLMYSLTLHMYRFRASGASRSHNALSSESFYLHVSLNVPCWHSVMSLLSCHNIC